MSDKLVKNLNFGSDAKDKIFKGIDKLTKAVSSTLGASGKCVILEDEAGQPVITKGINDEHLRSFAFHMPFLIQKS